MKDTLKHLNGAFGYSMLAFVVSCGVLLMVCEKGYFVLALNERHGAFGDVFFRYVTLLGEGYMFLAVLIPALLYRYYFGLMVVFSSIFTLAFSQGLKRTIFSGWPRPTAWFDYPVDFNYVEGVDVHSYNTFPSGHTLAAFTVFFLLAVMVKRGTWQTIFFVLALLVGISRVYLLQHFLIDIYFGSIFGVLSVVLGIFVTDKVVGKNNLDGFRTKSILNK